MAEGRTKVDVSFLLRGTATFRTYYDCGSGWCLTLAPLRLVLQHRFPEQRDLFFGAIYLCNSFEEYRLLRVANWGLLPENRDFHDQRRVSSTLRHARWQIPLPQVAVQLAAFGRRQVQDFYLRH